MPRLSFNRMFRLALLGSLVSIALFVAADCPQCFPGPDGNLRCGGGGGGPSSGAGGPPPGVYSHSEAKTSRVQLSGATYSGRLRITLSQPITFVSFVLSGYETCLGVEEEDWHTTYYFQNWGSVNFVQQGTFENDPLVCGAFFVSQNLQWDYAWSLYNSGGAQVLGTDADVCDLKDAGCAAYYGDP